MNVSGQNEPIAAQVLDVKWERTGLVLGIPPLVQALVLMAGITYANKVVTREGGGFDDSKLTGACGGETG